MRRHLAHDGERVHAIEIRHGKVGKYGIRPECGEFAYQGFSALDDSMLDRQPSTGQCPQLQFHVAAVVFDEQDPDSRWRIHARSVTAAGMMAFNPDSSDVRPWDGSRTIDKSRHEVPETDMLAPL